MIKLITKLFLNIVQLLNWKQKQQQQHQHENVVEFIWFIFTLDNFDTYLIIYVYKINKQQQLKLI